ncbi:hypothetical protein [Aeromonas veronii]|uniref:hypothetical protein n=1 Tax=Aeromonas veronii TaxID=654 RepID=UPI0019324D9A|nr:hypothetical protein [Aeromonas veronii]EKP0299438.1 hypothetical protein [Aeromonas veronii]MBM0419849.1 hypothetical protein [Aeromonas veronii]MBW3790351.1 hypothetical protein [Aeromonas veronii]
MNKVSPAPILPEGTILTEEGKDKIISGKVQRQILYILEDTSTMTVPVPELTDQMKRCHGVERQNVYRSLRLMESRGVLRILKNINGEGVICHDVYGGSLDERIAAGDQGIPYRMGDLKMSLKELRCLAGGMAIGTSDFVAGIIREIEENGSVKMFNGCSYARPDSKRWIAVKHLNKELLYKLATRGHGMRIDLDKALEAGMTSEMFPLLDQAARGAWQPFFDTLKKNQVIIYRDLKGVRTMIWDHRRWSVYSARVMRERAEYLATWALP